MTRVYKVWDSINASEATGVTLSGTSPDDVAVIYAENDVDGEIDNIYAQHSGHPICVKDLTDQTLYQIHVGVEYSPDYYVVGETILTSGSNT